MLAKNKQIKKINSDLISIVIPVYNTEKYVSQCIQSVLNQTYKDIEIILVDDGSTDNSKEIVDMFAKKNKNIKVFHKKNGGLSDSRNFGLSKSSGNLVMFVDSDDTIHKDMCTILYNNLKVTNADISACSWQKIYDINNYQDSQETFDKEKNIIFENDEVFDLLFNHKIPLIMSAWSKLYKKEFFEDSQYPVGKIHEDEYIIHKILAKCKKLVYTPLKMYNNLQRDTSITGQKFNKSRLHAIEARKDRVDFCKTNKPQFYQKALCQYLKTLAYYYYLSKKYKLGKDCLNSIQKDFNTSYPLLNSKPLSLKLFKFNKPLFCLLAKFKKL